MDYCSSGIRITVSVRTDKAFERVQHRFTRLFSDLKDLPYEDRLQQHGLVVVIILLHQEQGQYNQRSQLETVEVT